MATTPSKDYKRRESELKKAYKRKAREEAKAEKLAAKVGRTLPVIIDEVGEPDEDGDIGATGRSQADAPEIDGQVFLRGVSATLAPGDFVNVRIEDADQHDLFGAPA